MADPTQNQIIQREISKASANSRYTLNTTNQHQHTGTDSPRIDYSDLINKQFFASSTVPGALAEDADNYGTFYIAPFAVNIQEMQITYAVNSVSGVCYIEILRPGQASGAGFGVHGFDTSLSVNNNHVGTSKLRPGSKAIILQENDRLSLFMDGDPTGQRQLTVTVLLQVNN